MTEKYLVKIRYNGKGYYGLVLQPGKRTVLGEILKALNIKPLKIRVCSRTDKDVSAYENYIYLEFDREVYFPKTINKDIKILSIKKIEKEIKFKDIVKWKKYIYVKELDKPLFKPKYIILNGRKILVEKKSINGSDFNIDFIERMLECIKGEISLHNFTDEKRNEYSAKIYDIAVKLVKNCFYMEIKGNRFFHQSVRRLYSFLTAVGFGIFDLDYIETVFHEGILEPKPPAAPGKNLLLYRIKFKNEI